MHAFHDKNDEIVGHLPRWTRINMIPGGTLQQRGKRRVEEEGSEKEGDKSPDANTLEVGSLVATIVKK